MADPDPEPLARSLRDAARHDGRRRILGICGSPGAGKSTAAAAVVAALGADAVHVPMDGFHLADVELARLERLQRKGAPDTFDAVGYLALLQRIRAREWGVTCYAPAFDRTLEQPLAGAIAVPYETPVVVTEGNYLLLQHQPWPRIRALLDQVWWVDVDDRARRERLIRRHVQFGKSELEARRWVEAVDDVNARSVSSGGERADVVLGCPPEARSAPRKRQSSNEPVSAPGRAKMSP